MTVVLQPDPEFDAALGERRSCSRCNCCLDVLCHSGTIFWWPASLMTCSASGAGLVFGAVAEPGTKLTLSLRNGPRTGRDILGRVVHSQQFGKAWRVGIAFDELLTDLALREICSL
jgi:hypothetical protein